MKMNPVDRKDTEFAHWLRATPEQRSYLVEVLHWFHYRTTALKRSWTKEEVLTWELLRSLEILPQSMFLRPLLRSIATLSSETEAAVAPLLQAADVSIFRYPSLQLNGAKRNCRSDIGFGLPVGPTVWVEAKTAPFKAKNLHLQLDQQRAAMLAMPQFGPTALVTLLPAPHTLSGIPNLSWQEVKQVFEAGIVQLGAAIASIEIRRGYESLAVEFVQRIASHPNQLVDANVVQPGSQMAAAR